mgnify:CR=1 FL=1
MNDDFRLETLAVRAGQERSQFNEHAEALYLTSSFVFDSAAQDFTATWPFVSGAKVSTASIRS